MSDMWWHSYRTLWGFYPDDTEMQSGDPVGFGIGLFKFTRNCACVASRDGHNLLLLPPTATQTVCHLPVKYCVSLPSQLIWKGSVGRQRCPEGRPSSSCLSPPPPPPEPTWEMTLMRLGLVCVPLTNSSSSALVLRHQLNPPKGSLDAPVKEDHIQSATKIQAKHWGKPGVSQPGGCAVPQPAAPCALVWESLPSWILTDIGTYMCTCAILLSWY